MLTWSKNDLKQWQEEDPLLVKVVGWLGRDTPPTWEDLKPEGQEMRKFWIIWKELEVQEGILYRKKFDSTTNRNLWLLVAPNTIRQSIMQHLHNHRTAGHVGAKKTTSSVCRRFWWPGIRKDVVRWCQLCEACQRRNKRVGKSKTPMQSDAVGSPMERIAIDILSFKQETEDGNTCVLVVGDYFTKWAEAIPLPNHTAPVVADALVTEVFLRLGTLRILHSDQGAEFQSQLIVEICKLLEVSKTRTTPYHPQSDGMVERLNRTLIGMLSKLCSEEKSTWDQHLPYVMCAFRASEHEGTMCTPNRMMLGREIDFPIDIMYPRKEDEERIACPIAYVEWMRQAMEINFERVRSELQRATRRQKKYYDQRAQNRSFSVGEWVLRWYPPAHTDKLNNPYIGPYLVIDKLGPVTYKIQKSRVSAPITAHVDDLKPFHTEERQSWLQSNENPPSELQTPEGDDIDNSAADMNSDEPSHESSLNTSDLGHGLLGSPGERRPRRQHRLPKWLRDYCMWEFLKPAWTCMIWLI